MQAKTTPTRPVQAVEDSGAAGFPDCTPVNGLSTGFEAAEFNPFSLSQSSPGRASFVPQSPAAAHAGSAGALVTVLHSGRQASGITLTSVPTQLSHESLFSVSVSVAASAAFPLELQLLQHGSASPPLLSRSVQITPTSSNSSFQVVSVTHLRPASTGLFVLALGLGLAPANTLISLDDVVVCAEASASPSEHLGRLLPESSTGFESWSGLGFRGQLVSPADAAFTLRAPVAAKTGSFGASVMIRKPGDRPWHIQLAGPVVALSSSHAYLVQLSLRHTGPAATSAAALLAGSGTAQQAADPSAPHVQVSFVQDDTWLPTPIATLHPLAAGGRYMTYTLPAVAVPHTGSFFLSIDVGTMPAGSILHLDDIAVWEASAVSSDII